MLSRMRDQRDPNILEPRLLLVVLLVALPMRPASASGQGQSSSGSSNWVGLVEGLGRFVELLQRFVEVVERLVALVERLVEGLGQLDPELAQELERLDDHKGSSDWTTHSRGAHIFSDRAGGRRRSAPTVLGVVLTDRSHSGPPPAAALAGFMRRQHALLLHDVSTGGRAGAGRVGARSAPDRRGEGPAAARAGRVGGAGRADRRARRDRSTRGTPSGSARRSCASPIARSAGPGRRRWWRARSPPAAGADGTPAVRIAAIAGRWPLAVRPASPAARGRVVAGRRRCWSGAWTRDERAQVEATLRSVPAAIVARAAGASSAIARRASRTACRPTKICSTRRARRTCARPAAAAERSTSGSRSRSALLYGFDRAVGWSGDPGWRRINGWRLSIAHPLHPRPDNVNEAAFVAPRGGRSPRWDLVAFAVALFAR